MSAPTSRRSTSNANLRGNTAARAQRRAWLVTTYGDGAQVRCFHCRVLVNARTVSCDRIRPGTRGGTYARDNLRPSCLDCNVSEGGKLGRALQLGRDERPVKLTLAQHRVLIRVRCAVAEVGYLALGRRYQRTLSVLGKLGLVNWWFGHDSAGIVLRANSTGPLPVGVTL